MAAAKAMRAGLGSEVSQPRIGNSKISLGDVGGHVRYRQNIVQIRSYFTGQLRDQLFANALATVPSFCNARDVARSDVVSLAIDGYRKIVIAYSHSRVE